MTPANTREREVRQFVLSRVPWIKAQMASHQARQAELEKSSGASLWYVGTQLAIQAGIGPRNAETLQGHVLQVISRQPSPENNYLESRAGQWLRAQANDILPQRLARLVQQTGLTPRDLEIKSYRARWGSCRRNGLMQLNWKLIMAPVAVIDYVIVHELSHLEHFNHSPAFWAQVEKHCNDYALHRRWLKQHGSLLISRH